MNLTRRECLELELKARESQGRPPAPSLLDELLAARFQSSVLLKRATYLINAMGAPKPWFKIWR
jgi:hypothetical protein